MAKLRDVSLPQAGSASWYSHYAAMDRTLRSLAMGGFWLDEFEGTDDERLTAAIDAQRRTGDQNMPAIVLPPRPLTFSTPRAWYSGCKIIGPLGSGGQKNGELADGSYVGPEIRLAGEIASGAQAWWSNRDSLDACYDVLHAGFTLQGDQRDSRHQYADFATGTLYASQFHSISGNFMRAMYGDGASARKFLATQVVWSGSCTWTNAWGCQMHLGGSDVNIGMDICNVGTSPAKSHTGGVDSSFIMLDTFEGSVNGKMYLSTMNGWRGLKISGASSIDINGGVYEGFKPTRVDGLLVGPGPGNQILIAGGAVTMSGTKIGQGMDSPHSSEGGLLQIAGGEVNLNGVTFYGRNLGGVSAIRHTGGRLSALGILRRVSLDELSAWSGRPTISTAATVSDGDYSFCCPDRSLVAR